MISRQELGTTLPNVDELCEKSLSKLPIIEKRTKPGMFSSLKSGLPGLSSDYSYPEIELNDVRFLLLLTFKLWGHFICKMRTECT